MCMIFVNYCVLVGVFFFFFKQKTAYEMRISDWSSDVCSSDLDGEGQPPQQSAGRTIRLPSELLEAIFEAGRKGLSIQRYKGLGEMNAEQLWETTLDQSNRSMLQVEIGQADLADEILDRKSTRLNSSH